MAGIVKHKFQSPKADGADTTLVRPSNWNDEHPLAGGIDGDRLVFLDAETDNATLVGYDPANFTNKTGVALVDGDVVAIGATADRAVVLDDNEGSTSTWAVAKAAIAIDAAGIF